MGNEAQSTAFLASAMEKARNGKLAEAKALCEAAIEQNPKNATAIHVFGLLLHQSGEMGAEEALRHATDLSPSPQVWNDLGVVLAHSGRYDEAAQCFETALRLMSNFRPAVRNLADALVKANKVSGAIILLEGVEKTERTDAEVHLMLARLYRRAGRLADAFGSVAKAKKFSTSPSAELHHLLAQLHEDSGNHAGAEKSYRLAIEVAPGFADAYGSLGRLFSQLGRNEEALKFCQHATDLAPGSAGFQNNLGNVLQKLGRLGEAKQAYNQAIFKNPKFTGAYVNLALVLRRLGEWTQSERYLAQAVKLSPDHLEARLALAMAQLRPAYASEREIDERRDAYDGHLAALERVATETIVDHEALSGLPLPFYLPYQGRECRNLQERYGRLVCGGVESARSKRPTVRKRSKVRLGFVSGFFTEHSNWHMPLEGWITHLDRSKFHVSCYHTGIASDDVTALARSLSDTFAQAPQTMTSWRKVILADDLDVLVYPEIGMDPVSAQLAAQRLAPVQCNSWGHPITSGYPTMDYYLSSEFMEPSDGQLHYSEKLIRLPRLSVSVKADLDAVQPRDRSALQLEKSDVVYWCGHNVAKFLPRYDRIFPQIARQVSAARFLFIESGASAEATAIFKSRIARAFEEANLSFARHCIFLPRQTRADFRKAVAAADVFLDSIGWSACNATVESLRSCLPIVTFETEYMRGRHTGGILRSLELPDLIASSEDDYVRRAIDFGNTATLRENVAARIRRNRLKAFDDQDCVQGLQDFLLAVTQAG